MSAQTKENPTTSRPPPSPQHPTTSQLQNTIQVSMNRFHQPNRFHQWNHPKLLLDPLLRCVKSIDLGSVVWVLGRIDSVFPLALLRCGRKPAPLGRIDLVCGRKTGELTAKSGRRISTNLTASMEIDSTAVWGLHLLHDGRTAV